jgi:hypothetical protein
MPLLARPTHARRLVPRNSGRRANLVKRAHSGADGPFLDSWRDQIPSDEQQAEPPPQRISPGAVVAAAAVSLAVSLAAVHISAQPGAAALPAAAAPAAASAALSWCAHLPAALAAQLQHTLAAVAHHLPFLPYCGAPALAGRPWPVLNAASLSAAAAWAAANWTSLVSSCLAAAAAWLLKAWDARRQVDKAR